jgi:hypothetical protein
MRLERPFYNTVEDRTVWIDCEYEDIQYILEELGKDWVLGSMTKMSFSGNGGRDIYSKVDGGWKETLQRIKKGAGKFSQIHIP